MTTQIELLREYVNDSMIDIVLIGGSKPLSGRALLAEIDYLTARLVKALIDFDELKAESCPMCEREAELSEALKALLDKLPEWYMDSGGLTSACICGGHEPYPGPGERSTFDTDESWGEWVSMVNEWNTPAGHAPDCPRIAAERMVKE